MRTVWGIRIVLACAAVAVFAGGARANPSTWNVSGDGNWNAAGNWTPEGVPNSSTTDVRIDGNPASDVTVTLNMNASVRDLTLDAGDALHIANSRTLTLFGALSNSGLVSINPTAGTSTTTLQASEDLLLTGTGSVRLGHNLNAEITTDTGKTLTQQAGHTIEGAGVVRAYLVNHGTVRADAAISGGSELRLWTNDKINHGLFEAVGGSMLDIYQVTVTNTGATIRADGDGATVRLRDGARIVGGTLETANGGVFVTGTGAGTLVDVTNQGAFEVTVGHTLKAEGTLTNNGLIHVNPTEGTSTTILQASEDLLLTGTGSVRLGRSINARISTDSDKTLTQQAGHTIEGTGYVEAHLVNHGTVRADAAISGGSELRLSTNDKINHGLFEAVGGSTLDIYQVTVTNTGATIRADGDGATVRLRDGARILGGTLETANGGVFVTGSGAGTLVDVTNQGTFQVEAGHTLAAEGTLANHGLIHINPEAGASTTTLQASEDLLLTGTGIVRSGRWNAEITTDTGKTLTQQAGHTIAGTGYIRAHLVNHGTVLADATGSTLRLLTNEKTNHGTFSAVDGGILRVDEGFLANYDPDTRTLSGGTYEVIGDSTMRLEGVNVETLDAAIRLEGAGARLYRTASGTDYLDAALVNLTAITEAGSLVLSDGAGVTFAGAVHNTGLIGGTGTFGGGIHNAGTISPGNSIGTLNVTGDVFNSAEACLLIEVAGSGEGEFDRLNVTGAGIYEVGGGLLVRFLPGAEDLLETDVLTIVEAAGLLQSGEALAFGEVRVEQSGDFEVLYDPANGRIQLTGFQDIVSIPEPTIMGFLFLAAAAVLVRRRGQALAGTPPAG